MASLAGIFVAMASWQVHRYTPRRPMTERVVPTEASLVAEKSAVLRDGDSSSEVVTQEAPVAIADATTVPDSRQTSTFRTRTRATLSELRKGLGALFTLSAHDTSTAEGRSRERYRRAALSTVTSLLAHGLGVFTGLFSIRVTLGYLGKERYGLWMAISSLLTWAALADFGLARGMQNHLSEAHGQDDQDAAARYVSTGFAALSIVALVLAVVFLPVLFFMPWTKVLAVSDASLAGETRGAVASVVAIFLAGFPLSLVPTIYSAYQRGYVANLFTIVGSLLSLGTLVVVTRLHVSLPWLIVATGGIGVFMTTLNLGWIVKEMPWLRPRRSLVSMKALRALAATSTALMLFQLSSLLINEAQIIIVAHRLGLDAVADWSIFMRVHALPIVFISMLDGPMIPALREAHVRGEHKWLRTAFFRLTWIKMAIAFVAVGLYFALGNFAVHLLSGRSVDLPMKVWAASGFLLVVGVWNGSFNDLMIATNRLWFLVVTLVFNGVVTLGLTFGLARPYGIFGVVMATPVFSLVVSGWLLPWACRDLLRKRPDQAPEAVAERSS